MYYTAIPYVLRTFTDVDAYRRHDRHQAIINMAEYAQLVNQQHGTFYSGKKPRRFRAALYYAYMLSYNKRIYIRAYIRLRRWYYTIKLLLRILYSRFRMQKVPSTVMLHYVRTMIRMRAASGKNTALRAHTRKLLLRRVPTYARVFLKMQIYYTQLFAALYTLLRQMTTSGCQFSKKINAMCVPRMWRNYLQYYVSMHYVKGAIVHKRTKISATIHLCCVRLQRYTYTLQLRQRMRRMRYLYTCICGNRLVRAYHILQEIQTTTLMQTRASWLLRKPTYVPLKKRASRKQQRCRRRTRRLHRVLRQYFIAAHMQLYAVRSRNSDALFNIPSNISRERLIRPIRRMYQRRYNISRVKNQNMQQLSAPDLRIPYTIDSGGLHVRNRMRYSFGRVLDSYYDPILIQRARRMPTRWRIRKMHFYLQKKAAQPYMQLSAMQTSMYSLRKKFGHWHMIYMHRHSTFRRRSHRLSLARYHIENRLHGERRKFESVIAAALELRMEQLYHFYIQVLRKKPVLRFSSFMYILNCRLDMQLRRFFPMVRLPRLRQYILGGIVEVNGHLILRIEYLVQRYDVIKLNVDLVHATVTAADFLYTCTFVLLFYVVYTSRRTILRKYLKLRFIYVICYILNLVYIPCTMYTYIRMPVAMYIDVANVRQRMLVATYSSSIHAYIRQRVHAITLQNFNAITLLYIKYYPFYVIPSYKKLVTLNSRTYLLSLQRGHKKKRRYTEPSVYYYGKVRKIENGKVVEDHVLNNKLRGLYFMRAAHGKMVPLNKISASKHLKYVSKHIRKSHLNNKVWVPQGTRTLPQARTPASRQVRSSNTQRNLNGQQRIAATARVNLAGRLHKPATMHLHSATAVRHSAAHSTHITSQSKMLLKAPQRTVSHTNSSKAAARARSDCKMHYVPRTSSTLHGSAQAQAKAHSDTQKVQRNAQHLSKHKRKIALRK